MVQRKINCLPTRQTHIYLFLEINPLSHNALYLKIIIEEKVLEQIGDLTSKTILRNVETFIRIVIDVKPYITGKSVSMTCRKTFLKV